MSAHHIIETPLNTIGAVSIIRIVSSKLDSVLKELQNSTITIGQIRLVSFLDLDDALIARFDEDSLLVMPHGGIGITRAISSALTSKGIGLQEVTDPLQQFPEASDMHEARMLGTLARAASPIAMDVLLDQPERWRTVQDREIDQESWINPALDRLVTPPIVVAVGRANIGKSSLVNALAGDSVAMVSDYAGTTRDHLGVQLNLAGLVVRWVDTPGIDESVKLGDELELMKPIFQSADLVVHAVDLADSGSQASPMLDPRLLDMIGNLQILRVGVRADLARTGTQPDQSIADLACSSKTRVGIREVARSIRELLVPTEQLTSASPWRFWG